MKLSRLYSVKRPLFGLQQATNIKKEIEYITEQANKKIQALENIDKYQQLFGKVTLCVNNSCDGSILHRFEHVNWNRLDKTIPKWSYPFVYELAVKNSNPNKGYYRNPESYIAIDYAEKTVKELEKIFEKID